jgi:hypothetical protein
VNNFFKIKLEVILMNIEVKDINDKEVVISKDDLSNLLNKINDLNEMIFAQKEVIKKIIEFK